MSVASAGYTARLDQVGRTVRWGVIAAAVIVVSLAYGPLMWMFFRQQWEKPHYQYFPFVIAAFGWLLYQRYQEGAPRVPVDTQRQWIDWLWLAASFSLLLFSIPQMRPWGA